MGEVYPRERNRFAKNKITPSTSQVTWHPLLRRQIWMWQCCQLLGGKMSLPQGYFPSENSLRGEIFAVMFEIKNGSQLWVRKMMEKEGNV